MVSSARGDVRENPSTEWRDLLLKRVRVGREDIDTWPSTHRMDFRTQAVRTLRSDGDFSDGVVDEIPLIAFACAVMIFCWRKEKRRRAKEEFRRGRYAF